MLGRRLRDGVDEIELVATAGETGARHGERIPYRGSITERAQRRGEPVRFDHFADASATVPAAMVEIVGEWSGALVPMIAGGESIGALLVVRRPDRPVFGPLRQPRRARLP